MTAARKGFSKVYNALLDPDIYTDQNAKNLYLHLCLHAVFEDKPQIVKGVTVNKGQFLTTFYKLEKVLLHKENNQTLKGKPRSTWQRAADKLAEKALIRYEETGKGVLFTVIDLGADTLLEGEETQAQQGAKGDSDIAADTKKGGADTSADTFADTSADTLLEAAQSHAAQGIAANRIGGADTFADTSADTFADTPILNNNVFKNYLRKDLKDDDDILGIASQIATFPIMERNRFINNLVERKFGYLPKGNFFEDLTEIENELGYEVTIWALLQINGKINNPQSFYIDYCNKMRQNGVKTIAEAEQFATQEKERHSKRYAAKRTGTEGGGVNRVKKPAFETEKKFDFNF